MASVEQSAAGQAKAAGDKAGRSFKDGFAKPLSQVGAGFKKAFVPALAGLGLVALGAHKAISAASDLNEQVNKTGVVFGNSSKDLLQWSKNASTAMGQSRRQALEAAGTFGNMLVPMGFARKEAAHMSKTMVQLGSDMASFNNASPEETLDAIRSGLAGETEPLRRFGVFLSQARIQQEALNLGLIKGADSVKPAMATLAAAQTTAAAATRAHEAAARQLTAAQDAVAVAQKAASASSDALALAQKRATVAADQVSTAEDRQKKASNTLRDAKNALRAAQDNARASQLALTDARKKATEQLQALKDSAVDAALSEERASIGVERARQRLSEVTADSSSTDLDKREAALSLAEAERSLQEAQDKRAGVATDLADAEKKGVEGSDAVVAARKAAAQADDEADKASRRVTASQAAYAKAQDQVRVAVQNLLAVQDRLRTARQDDTAATARLTVAQDRLDVAQKRNKATADAARNAQDALSKAKAAAKKASSAMTKQLTAEQKAQATYSIILKDTKDAQGDFVRTSSGVANQQRIIAARSEDTAATIGKKLLPAQQRLNALTLKFFDLLTKHQGVVGGLVVTFTALAAAIVAVNIGMKIYAAGAAVVKAATAAWTAVQWLLDASFAPLLLVPVALAAIAIGMVIAYKKSETFRAVIDGLFGAIVDGAKWVLDFFKSNWEYVVAGIILGPFGLILVGIVKHWDEIKAAITDGVDAVLKFLKSVPDKLLAAGTALGKAIKDGAVNGLTGVVSALWDVLSRISAKVAEKASEVAGWGARVGGNFKDAVVDGVVGIATGVWGIAARIPGFFRDNLATIVQWGAQIGGWIRDAIVDGLTGFAVGVWGWLGKAKQFITDNKAELVKLFTEVGTWIRDAIVAGLAGLGNLIREAVKKAIRSIGGKLGGAVGKATGIFKGAAPQGVAGWVPGPVQAAAGLGVQATASSGTGALAGAPPPLYNLRQLMSTMQREAAPPPEQPLEVRVFIGDTELKGIVRTEVRRAGDATARVLLAASNGVA